MTHIMIWDDPWIVAATTKNPTSPFCTRIPPPPVAERDGLSFDCVTVDRLPNIEDWIDLVGSRWIPNEVRERLEGAWIALVTEKSLIGTCVLRPPTTSRAFWVLETLTVRQAGRGKGVGAFLMRSAMSWIWRHGDGPFQLAYTWELGLPQLVWSWWRGWLRSAIAIQRGWYWSAEGCGFCPQSWKPVAAERLVLPTLIGGAVVSDSGKGDDWGYVLAFREGVDWISVAKKGGWRWLWYRGSVGPAGWQWTGEFVVVGVLNASVPPAPYWFTAEI